ncbi:Ectoine dioxygenase [wastewater metagenome]|uniref:Ectoine dioxygenase n=3 Tax=root TaxID=1 RepID=A0A5B8R7S2_9ZZZZ|nr:ectoine dioxygenase [uncultured organism]
MLNSKDLYPTRTEAPVGVIPRLDPVIHSDENGHWSGPLTSDELRRFEHDGYLFFEGLFPPEEVEAFREELRRLEADPDLNDWDGMIREPESNEVRSVFGIHRADISDRFNRLARDPRLLDRVRQLLASEVYIHQSRINYKPGFRGTGFNWHSDFETWHAEDGMPRMRAVSCSIILTDNHALNGPLMLIPGSHKHFVSCVGATPEDNYRRSLKVQEFGVPDEDAIRTLARERGIDAATGPAGSLLIFECNTLHASNANMSPDPRSNVFFVYNSVRNRPQQPYGAPGVRPAFLGEREDFTPLER